MRHFVWLTFLASLLLLFPLRATLVAGGSPDLLVAIRNGDHAQVQNLIRAGADANATDNDGTTALMHSVLESDVPMMKLLIDAGANINAKNAVDSTALMYAATNLAKARLLLDAGADVNARGKHDATAMGVAVTTFGSTPVLKLLASKGAKPDARLMTTAAATGDLDAMQYLLSAGIPSDGFTGAAISAAITARCEACARWLVEQGAPASGVRPNGTQSTMVGSTLGGVLNDAAKRAMPELSQFLLDHGASLESRDREGFTLLMQAVLSMEPPAARDRMVGWLLSKGVDPNAKNDRGDTAYQLAAREGTASTLALLAKAGAKEVHEDWPTPVGAASVDAAVRKAIPLIEMSGEPGWKSRQCVSCHSNSMPAMTVSLARKKGFAVNEAQARKELGFAIATDVPVLEDNRLGASPVGGGSDNALADADATGSERAPFVKALTAAQNQDGSWSQLPGTRADAYATGEALYALYASGSLPARDPVYQKGVQWLLRNQLADGSWFAPSRAVPVQPHTFESFPNGWHQFASDAASSWATMALLFTLPDRAAPPQEISQAARATAVATADYASKTDTNKDKASDLPAASYKTGAEKLPVSNGDPAAGKQIFAGKCEVCHNSDTRETKVGPGLKDLFHWPAHALSDGTQHSEHNAEVIRKQIVEGGGAMDPVGASFSDQEIADLIAYLQTL